MQQQLVIATAIGILVGMISIGVPTFLFTRLRDRLFQKLTDAYERIIAKCDARVNTAENRLSDYMDRYYASQNLPVGGVDMLEEHKERKGDGRGFLFSARVSWSVFALSSPFVSFVSLW